MADLTVSVEVPDGLRTAGVLLSDEVLKGLSDSGHMVEATAKQLANTSTGNLRRSIMSQVTPIADAPTAAIVAQAHYAPYVEHGTKPHTPPFGPIARWAIRHGMQPGQAWGAIKKRGTQPHPFLRPALERQTEAVRSRMKRALADFVQRMSGK